jgi:hypothetical protein
VTRGYNRGLLRYLVYFMSLIALPVLGVFAQAIN